MHVQTLASWFSLLSATAIILASTLSLEAADNKSAAVGRYDLAERTFQAACNSCHYRGATKQAFGRRSPLGAATPDEAAEFILFGKAPEDDEGGMPAFGPGFSDAGIVRLLVWMRSTAAPDTPWKDVAASVAAMRATGSRQD